LQKRLVLIMSASLFLYVTCAMLAVRPATAHQGEHVWAPHAGKRARRNPIRFDLQGRQLFETEL
jgi:outer membrane biogenesis lipoprotein LolB